MKVAKTIAISSPLLTRFCLILSNYDINIHHIHFQIPNWIFFWTDYSRLAIYIHSLGTFGQIIPLNDQNKSFVVYCNNRLTPSPYSTLFLFACHSCLTWHSWSSWTREYCRYLCTVVNINAGHFIRSLENYTFWICNMYHNFVITIVIYILSNDSY